MDPDLRPTQSFPKLAAILGIAGLLPFVACALLGVGSTEPLASEAVTGLLAYGAVILAFLGGVHWGFVLSERTDLLSPPLQRQRLVAGVLPALLGWAALLLNMAVASWLGLAVLIVGFAAFTVLEQRWRQAELVPVGYMMLRWVLSLAVILILAFTLILRLVGGHLFL